MTSTTRKKPYYSVRTGKNPLAGGFDIEAVRDLFKTIFVHFEEEGYFQEDLGYYCVDAGDVAGRLGHNLDGALLLALRKRNLTPIRSRIESYSEDDLFDIIEFLYDHCSKPKDGTYHNWNGCGWHYETFEREPGREEFKERVNKVLAL